LNNEPVISAEPVYGKGEPAFSAYDAVIAYEALVAVVALPCREPVNEVALILPNKSILPVAVFPAFNTS
jgi:hypothetical protein